MQTCPACGRENPDGFLLCGYCGTSLTAPVTERRKLATLVFCDMSGSTAMGERVDPETVRGLMLSYFQEMRVALERHGGTVEKFVGDAVLAVFGVPEAHEDDALRACRAALEMQARLAALNEELERRYEARIALRIGVNSGEVVAGDPSSRETFVTGDPVNVAARLEQAAAPGEVLIGEPTYRLVRDAVTVDAVEPVAAKGKAEPVAAYRLLDVAGLGPAPRRTGSALVGRAGELALLEREFEAAVEAGACRLVTVVGEPGVGKSRLAAEMVERIGPQARVVRGACLSYGEGITYWPVAQILRELAGIRDEDSVAEARARLDDVLGEVAAGRIAQLLGLADGAATRDQTTQAIVAFLSTVADERPLLVLVDDIQWAEPALLDLLGELSRRLRETPLLLLCLARPELLEHRPEWPVAVALEPLAASELDTLLDGLDAPPAARERIALVAAGNPLFAEELVAWVREGGDLGEMPTSLNALLGARLDRLAPDARHALERGAIEGELFHRGAVVELSDEGARPAVPGGLVQLTGKDMIRPTAAAFADEIAYRFKHILVREAAYRATAKKLRATLHERFAVWLERLAGERVGEYQEILGYHFEQAYRYRAELGPVDDDDARALAARAAGLLGAAGRRANDRYDVRAAANLLGRAVGLFPLDSLERLELLRPYDYALNETGRVREAQAIRAELYERATAVGARGLAAHGRFRGVMTDLVFDLDEVRAIAEEGIETFTELGDVNGLASAEWRLGNVCRVQGLQAEAGECFERALVHANACGDLVIRRTVTEALAMTLCRGPMPVGDALRRNEELREDNRDDRVLDAAITRCLSELLAMAGRFEEAREAGRTSDGVLEEANVLTSSRATQGVAAYAKEYAGDRAGAERDLEAMLLAFRNTLGGAHDRRGIEAAVRLANLYCDDGRWDDAAECLALHRDAPDPTSVPTTALRRAAAARVAAHRDELDEAALSAQRALEITAPSDMLNIRAVVWHAVAEVERAARNDAAADAAVATALELYEQKGNVAAADALRATAQV